MATDLCLQLLRFSHATGVRSDNSVPWTHLAAQNLFAIVKGTDTDIVDGKLTLRVVHDTTVLESIDIADYVDRATNARRAADQAGLSLQVEQLAIFGITKESLLALRYSMSDGQARRLQLRLQNVTECSQIVSLMKRRGMEFREQRSSTARPGTGLSYTGSMTQRPSTTQNSLPHFKASTAGPHPGPFQSKTLEAGSLSRMRTLSPERPDNPDSMVPTRAEATSQEMPPPPFLLRDEVSAPREVEPTRPSTAQIYRSYTTPSHPSQYEAHNPEHKILNSSADRPWTSHHESELSALERPSPVRASSVIQQPSSSSSVTNPHSDGVPQSSQEYRPATARPSTAASTFMMESLELEIPPRRELPFKRSDSRCSDSNHSGSRPGSSALTMPPLPKPKLVSEGSGPSIPVDSVSPSKSAAATRPGTTSPLKSSFVVAADGSGRPQTSAPSAPTLQSPVRRAHSPPRPVSPPAKPRSPSASSHQTSRMEELLCGRKPSSEQSINTKVPRISSLVDAPYQDTPPVSPVRAGCRPTLGSPARTNYTEHDATLGAYAALKSSAHGTSLAGYAAQSDGDRQATLDEFMIANLENPAFTILCEDVENCWRRIGLGL